MRIFLLAAAIAATSAPAGAATRNFGIQDFQKVRVEGPFKVRLATGVAPFARASGSPAALDRVAIDVRGDTLVVHSNLDSWGGYPGRDVGPVEVSIGTHDLSAAWLNGSGAISIDRVKGLKFDLSVQGSGTGEIGRADIDQLNVSVVGTANARLSGEAAKMTAVIRGISSLDASALATKDATLGADGAATVAANVSNSVTVDATGPATVKLSGGPACTLRVSGSASVSGCR
ncbi:MAG: GIN domain-containing protein [Bacillota bacterium]